jgi:uncharacterized membrane protein YhaH (DUF805 family)
VIGIQLQRPSLTWQEAFKWAASIAGYALGIGYIVLITQGRLEPGIDLGAYLRAGLDLRAGQPVYVGQIGDATNFPYAPTWAVIAAAASFLPGNLLQAGLMLLDIGAVRYVCGSWRAAGYVFAWPLTAFVMTAGNVDLLIAAAIVMAWRVNATPLALMSLTKLAPALALPPRRWREIALAAVICFVVTVPWLHLWPEWIAYLLRQPALIGISIPIPWYFRLPVALALIAWLRKPWAAALAVAVAMPSLYLSTSVILIAPIRLYLDERAGRGGPKAAEEPGYSGTLFAGGP